MSIYQDRITARTKHAEYVRQFRSLFQEMRADQRAQLRQRWASLRMTMADVMVDWYGVAPAKPTVASLTRELHEVLDFVAEPIPHSLPCGAQDALGDRKDEAMRYAHDLLSAIVEAKRDGR